MIRSKALTITTNYVLCRKQSSWHLSTLWHIYHLAPNAGIHAWLSTRCLPCLWSTCSLTLSQRGPSQSLSMPSKSQQDWLEVGSHPTSFTSPLSCWLGLMHSLPLSDQSLSLTSSLDLQPRPSRDNDRKTPQHSTRPQIDSSAFLYMHSLGWNSQEQ
jgi:hypothetical protein